MKKLRLSILSLGILVLALSSCKKEEPTVNEVKSSNLPSTFKVDIPDAISYEDNSAGKTDEVDTLQGNHVYAHLRTFIKVGEGAADIVQAIVVALNVYNINQAMTFSYQSNEDGRTKNVVVTEGASFDGKNYEFKLNIKDALSEGNADQGFAMQLFWNTTVAEGVAILKPYNINRTEHENAPDAVFRVDYGETGEFGYEQHMIVQLSGLPIPTPLLTPYAMDNLKMFAGKTGNTVDVYGGSNHPNAKFFNNSVGYNWAFVASGRNDLEIGVAEVGIPLNTLSSSDRNILLVENSIKQVFTDQIYEIWPNINQNDLDAYLANTEAPGFFNQSGFVQAGTAPNNDYVTLENRIQELIPYNPSDIKSLEVAFQP